MEKYIFHEDLDLHLVEQHFKSQQSLVFGLVWFQNDFTQQKLFGLKPFFPFCSTKWISPHIQLNKLW